MDFFNRQDLKLFRLVLLYSIYSCLFFSLFFFVAVYVCSQSYHQVCICIIIFFKFLCSVIIFPLCPCIFVYLNFSLPSSQVLLANKLLIMLDCVRGCCLFWNSGMRFLVLQVFHYNLLVQKVVLKLLSFSTSLVILGLEECTVQNEQWSF